MSPTETHRSIHRLSRFGRFMNVHHIVTARLADVSGVSRQHIYRLRYGLLDATVVMMLRLRDGCRLILRRRIFLSEIYDIGEDDILLRLTEKRSADSRFMLRLIMEP